MRTNDGRMQKHKRGEIMYYIFYGETETQYELLGKATTMPRAEEMKSYYNKKHKLPATRINIMKIVG